MTTTLFGTLRDGTDILQARIGYGDLSVSVISLGAAIQDLRLAGAAGGAPLVLGYQTPQDYLDRCFYFGAIVGRFANRIAGGRFVLDGETYQLSCNEGGVTHLHGGADGFFARNWTIVEAGRDFVQLSLTSPDGDQGYPGQVEVSCRYQINGRTLSILLTAHTDAPTVVSLAPHSYFNLEGGGDVLGHRLQIAADRYTPLDAANIPTGEIASVAATRFDFRSPRPLAAEPADRHAGYDLNLVLADAPSAEPRVAARISAPHSGLSMEVWTTEPGLQLYDSGFLIDPAPGLDGAAYPRFGGLCLEPQRFPDSPNHPGFTDAVLRSGRVYRQLTEYRFA